MALFTLHSDITIGQYRFDGVHEVTVRRHLNSFVDTAVIKLPQQVAISGDGGVSELQTAGKLFQDGDYVLIRLGYDGGGGADMRVEFEGFVKRRTLTIPLEIECEGYSWQMRNNVNVTGFLATTKASELLALATGAGRIVNNRFEKVAQNGATGINTIIGDGGDLPLHNITFNNNNGCEILKSLKDFSQGTLQVFFITPRTLWCGYPYTAYNASVDPFQAGVANYRLGFNCVKDNGLKERTPVEKTQVIFQGLLATGEKVRTEGQMKAAKNKLKATFNYVQSEAAMKRMAEEKALRLNYSGYEGYLTGFLQPYCQPGWAVNVLDDQYPERDGRYLCESTTVTFGIRGARRKVELGPRIGFSI